MNLTHSHKRMVTWAPFQYPIRRLIVRSREVSKPRDWCLELSDCSEIWQAPQQRCCRGACQMSEQCDNSNYQSRGFETSRDLTIRRLIGYWNGALIPCQWISFGWPPIAKYISLWWWVSVPKDTHGLWCWCKICRYVILTHWGWDKMAAFSQTTFSNALSSIKMFEFRLWFHWSLFLRFE